MEREKGEVEFKIVPTAAGEQAEAPGERLPDRETGRLGQQIAGGEEEHIEIIASQHPEDGEG